MSTLSRRDLIRRTIMLSAGSLVPWPIVVTGEMPGSAAPTRRANPISLGFAAEGVFDYMVAHCTCQPPGLSFWRNPHGKGLPPDQNGWQGAQAIQNAVINYEATHHEQYLKVVERFADWIDYTYVGRKDLTLCETWPGWNMITHKPIGTPPPHFCIWSDDSGWVANLYLQISQYLHRKHFLQYSYDTLLNLDKRWGVDFQANSRGLMYYDHQDRYSIYIAAQIIAALGLFDAFRGSDPAKAEKCLAIASKYYNFVENYLHSTGPGHRNITGAKFGVAKDLFEEEANFGFGDRRPPVDASSTLKSDLFTSPHMMMTAAYEMFHRAARAGGDIRQVDSRFRDFEVRARNAADAFVRPYPDGYVQSGSSGQGTVVMNLFDSNVNGFGCYWWTKYVVPLNPERYGGVILRTAENIVADQGTGNVSSPCWSVVGCTPETSHSSFGGEQGWVMVREASAASMIAAGRWIETAYPELA